MGEALCVGHEGPRRLAWVCGKDTERSSRPGFVFHVFESGKAANDVGCHPQCPNQGSGIGMGCENGDNAGADASLLHSA